MGYCNNQKNNNPGLVAHTFNPNTVEAEADKSLWVWGQPGPYSEFKENPATNK